MIAADKQARAVYEDFDPCHYVCPCTPDLALCGEWSDPDEPYLPADAAVFECLICADLAPIPCPRCGDL